jgi:hypothetical protein
VLSMGDKHADVSDKIMTYLEAGTSAVIVVDPRRETIAVHGRDGMHVLRAGDTLTHAALLGFSLDVDDARRDRLGIAGRGRARDRLA